MALVLAALALAACPRVEEPAAAPEAVSDRPAVGRAGGRLVVALRAEPRTLNPVTAYDNPSVTVLRRMHADLVHIDRFTQETQPALAESWSFSEDGREITVRLRRGVRFSDGEPFDADDVLFSFEVYLDEEVGWAGRDLMIVGGEPLRVRKIDAHTVAFEMAAPNAVGERLFDSVLILPEHLLREPYEEGRIAEQWATLSAPETLAGLGPFRLREYVPGQRLALERNPHYWRRDADGRVLPYLEELVFLLVPSQDAQAIRFQSGETDLVDHLSAENFEVLERSPARSGYRLVDLGPGLTYHFLFFNRNDLAGRDLGGIERKQLWFSDVEFRRAVSEGVDRQAIARLVFRGRAEPLATHVTSGNKLWRREGIEPPPYSPEAARRRLAAAGYRWDEEGRLRDGRGEPVSITIVTNSGNSQRVQMGTLLQEDLGRLGIEARLVPIEFRALLDRVFNSFDYEACILALRSGDVDPNTDLNVWLSDGGSQMWRLSEGGPADRWEAEIDRLMREQVGVMDRERRLEIYGRVQELIAESVPVVFLVADNVLVGAKRNLGNFRPAVLDHSTLWNADELFWQPTEAAAAE